MPNWMAMTFQDSISPSMEHILFFHDHAMIILILITTMTLYLIVIILATKSYNKFSTEGQEIETVWTVLPAIMLVFIAFPSLKTLYTMEDTKMPMLSIKSIGHQWYWSYEYSINNEKEIETFMENSNMLRLLKTNETIKLPTQTNIRNLVTSVDVIHSWTIPSLGVKVDALPGRLNQMFFMSKRLGLYTGQCSEICGTNHSFMPITLNFVTTKMFIKDE